MMVVAKMMDGRIVQIVKVADRVQFSADSGWVFVCLDFDKSYAKREQFKWMPIATQFTWVREFVDA
jgi:hypothetical protein